MRFSILTRILVIQLVLLIGLTSGLELDEDGGYHVSIGLKGEQQPEDTPTLLDTIQAEMEALSELMFTASGNKFFIKSATVVIPSHWEQPVYRSSASSQSFNTADIKVSDGALLASVRRATHCGHPGEDIQLPTDFFTNIKPDRARDKALLHLWAQYRWGMFEESGFPFNPRFPYFNSNEENGTWEPNSCTDHPLSGNIELENGTSCVIEGGSPPAPECRFRPDDPQPEEIHSSLLTHYHHLMDSFCTPETHNSTIPTPHNYFCRGLSASEVLEMSDDYQTVTAPVDSKPGVIFTRVKQSALPLLHFILDARIAHQAPEDSIMRIEAALRTMFDFGTGVDEESLAAITIFPGSGDQVLEEIIPWTVIRDSANDFRLAIDHISTVPSAAAQFGHAIKIVSDAIRHRQHPEGGIIFVFKASSGSDFDKMTFEEEVMLSLLSHDKIQVHAIEVNNGPLDPGTNLRRLTSTTGGTHISVNSANIGTELDTFMQGFILATKSPNFTTPTLKPLVSTMGQEVRLPVLPTSGSLILRLTTAMELGQVQVVGFESDQAIDLIETQEWEEGHAQGRRRTFTASITVPSTDGETAWSLRCDEDVNMTDCRGFFALYGENEDVRLLEDNMSVTLSTFFDQDTGILFIYALLEEEGEPLVWLDRSGRLVASADLCLQNNPAECWTIFLVDDGEGLNGSDLLSDDGIISGWIAPPFEDVVYSLRVSVGFNSSNISSNVAHRQLQQAEVKAVGETRFPCAYTPEAPIDLCVGRVPSASFQVVSSLPYPLIIKEVAATPTTPDGSSPTTQDSSSPTTPEPSAPTTPDSPSPTTPDSSSPTIPDGSSPTTPDGSSPTTPDSSSPTIPDGSSPTTPDGSSPTTPDGSSPTTPNGSSPTTPDGSSPTTPDSSSPTTPDGSSPTTPDTSTPTAGPSTELTSTTGRSDEPPSTTSTSDVPSTTEGEDGSSSSSTTTTPRYSTFAPSTTEKPEYFFKTTAGYATLGAIALLALGGLCTVIGILVWKRRALSMALAARSPNHI